MLVDGLTLLDDSKIKKTFTLDEDYGEQFPTDVKFGKRFELTKKFGDYEAGVYVRSQSGWIPVTNEDVNPHDISMSVLGELPQELDVMRFLVNRTTMIYENFRQAKAVILSPTSGENRLEIKVYRANGQGTIKLGDIVCPPNETQCSIIPTLDMHTDYFLEEGDILAVYSSATELGCSDMCLTISGSIVFA